MCKIQSYKKKIGRKDGFTLVEVIIVLVILAILASVIIPSLTGYIDKADEEKARTEARYAYMAAEAGYVEWYAFASKAPANYKRECESYLAELLDAECGMTLSGNNSGWTGSNSFEVATGTMILSGSYSWNNFRNSYKSGGNRALIWINGSTNTIKGFYYMTKDKKYAVRMIFEPTATLPEAGTIVEKTS